MKAVSDVPSLKKTGCGEVALHCLSEHSLSIARCKMEEESLDLQYNMKDCYSKLKQLVPTIPPNKKVSKVEILQHVIDYILDLQLALETHPALARAQPAASCPSAPRTPLTALNTEQSGSKARRQEDSILCR